MYLINNEKTKEEFGYTLEDLIQPFFKLGNKKVYRICPICQKEEIVEARRLIKSNQTKCLRCSNQINSRRGIEEKIIKNKENWKIYGHPRLNKKHSEESKNKMSKSRMGTRLSAQHKEKLSQIFSGNKNPFYGKKHSEESLNKMRLAAQKNARRGKESNFYGKSFYAKYVLYKKKNGETIKLKSSWEEKFAFFLDEKNIVWDYEKIFFPITYIYEGKEICGTYTPDFFLENGIIFEIKGYWRKDAKIKFEAFKKTYPHVEIYLIQKQEMRKLKLIK